MIIIVVQLLLLLLIIILLLLLSLLLLSSFIKAMLFCPGRCARTPRSRTPCACSATRRALHG